MQRYYGLCHRCHSLAIIGLWRTRKRLEATPETFSLTLRARDDLQLNTLSAKDKCWNGYGLIKWFFKPNASFPMKTYGSILSDCGSLEGCGMLRRPFSIA